jgi:hypothetical protein
MFTMAGFILWDKMKTTYNNRHNVYNGWFYPLGQDEDNWITDTMFTMAGLILWDKMKITYNNRHNVYNGWFYPLGQDEDNIQ